MGGLAAASTRSARETQSLQRGTVNGLPTLAAGG